MISFLLGAPAVMAIHASLLLKTLSFVSDNGLIDEYEIKSNLLFPIVSELLEGEAISDIYRAYKSSVLFDSEGAFIASFFNHPTVKSAINTRFRYGGVGLIMVPMNGFIVSESGMRFLTVLIIEFMRSYLDLCLFDILPRHVILNYSLYFSHSPHLDPFFNFRTVAPGIVRDSQRIYDLRNSCTVRVEGLFSLIPDLKGMILCVLEDFPTVLMYGKDGSFIFPDNWDRNLWITGEHFSLTSSSEQAYGYRVYSYFVRRIKGYFDDEFRVKRVTFLPSR